MAHFATNEQFLKGIGQHLIELASKTTDWCTKDMYTTNLFVQIRYLDFSIENVFVALQWIVSGGYLTQTQLCHIKYKFVLVLLI